MIDESKFNREQLDAILASSQEDILISAGAGSGKTNTLSERVSEMLLKGEINPSELLVLTFTNNAAHEMKERIIAKFPKEEKEKARELLSSHIQTFDSLYQYLVSSYANELGLSSNLNVLDKTIAKTKQSEIIDSLFSSYYENPSKTASLLSIIKKFDMKDDSQTKKIVLSLWTSIDKLSRPEKNLVLNDYDGHYLSDDFIDSKYHELVSSSKSEFEEVIYEAAFADYFYPLYSKEGYSVEKAKEAFSSRGFWETPYANFAFAEDSIVDPMYRKILELLSFDDEEFVAKANSFKEDNEAFFKKVIPGLEKDSKAQLEAPWKIMKAAFGTKSAALAPIRGLLDKKSEREKVLYYRDDIIFLLQMIKEADAIFTDFKRATNSFTFSDYAEFALALMNDEKYEKCAKEVRNRFSYIMVDEYQDTNPKQEALLSSLLKERDDGSRAHLFAVGDAKQSIYLFNGSEVALFRNRQRQYSSGVGHRVINMNRNYRSGKKLLQEINYICSYYMRLDHGFIDYKNDPSEHLLYDDKVNLYGKEYDNFCISRIVTPNDAIKKEKRSALDSRTREANIIVEDIKKKISEGYLVYDRSEKAVRPCRYNDFAILSSVKSSFRMYEQIFTQNGIKLNKKVSDNLRETDSIILIESLLRMYAYFNGDESQDIRHLFASIARSYAFEYTDTKLYELLHYENGGDQYLKIKSDPLWEELERFSRKNALTPSSDVFLALIDEFHVIDHLPKIGEVANVIAKIDSLYQMILENEMMGNGIKEFLSMLSEMDKHSLECENETLTNCDDAVDMMTIHASKGLERKIVYLPVSLNSMGRGDMRNASILSFSMDKGIVLPYLRFEPTKPYSPLNEYSVLTDTVLTRKKANYENDPLIDDHTRLFYVALTRAENQIVIVGDNQKSKENLYAMLNCCPHFIRLNDRYFTKKIDEGIIKKKDYEAFLANGENCKLVSLPFSTLPSFSAFRAYKKMGEEHCLQAPLRVQNEILDLFCLSLYEDYLKKIKEITDLDELASIYAALFLPMVKEAANIASFASLVAYLNSANEEKKEDIEVDYEDDEEDDGEDDDGEEKAISFSPNLMKSTNKEWLVRNTIAHLLANDYEFFFVKKSKKMTEEDMKLFLSKQFLPALARYFDDTWFIAYTSYENEGYEDRVFFAEEHVDAEQAKVAEIPEFKEPRVDEREFVLTPTQHKRASKKITLIDSDAPSSFVLDRGSELHRHLEMVDIASGDVSFISDYDERRLIKRVLDLPIMRLAKESIIHTEYQFYDPNAHSTGSIDLLFIHDEEYYIIDYKTSRINDPAYVEQLSVYADNISRIFNVEKAKIHLYLVSIVKGEQKEITL